MFKMSLVGVSCLEWKSRSVPPNSAIGYITPKDMLPSPANMWSKIVLWTQCYRNGATYHTQYVPTPLTRTIAQSTNSVRIHNFQCLNRSHCGRTFVPATITI